MAAARCAARRLGGSLLQRAQAAATSPPVAGERRRLMPRRFHSEKQSNAANQHFYEEYPESLIKQKKEELYNLISEADKQFVGEAKNRRLLQSLSEYVEPRPHDPEWRRLTRKMQISRWILKGGVASWILAVFVVDWGEVIVAQQKQPSVLGQAEVAQQEVGPSWREAGVAQLEKNSPRF